MVQFCTDIDNEYQYHKRNGSFGRPIHMIRKSIFWTHLVTATITGLVILNLGITGVLLTYERQIRDWATIPSLGNLAEYGERLTLEALLEKQASRQTDETPSRQPNVVLSSDDSEPIQLRLGRRGGSYIHPYTGEELAIRNPWVIETFQFITSFHRWFSFSGESRPYAKFVVGVANLAFLFLVVSGLYLWFPRRWIRPLLRTSLVPKTSHASTKARDHNWHLSIGFWSAIPLIVVIVTGSVFSFRWTGDLIYGAFGVERPGPPQRLAPAPESAPILEQATDQQRSGRPVAIRVASTEQTRGGDSGSRRASRNQNHAPTEPSTYLKLDQLVESAKSLYPDWQELTVTPPRNNAPTLTVLVDMGNGGQPQLRETIQLDRKSGALISSQSYDQLPLAQRIRGMVRFLHTGDYFGIVGQTIAGLVSLTSVLMVWTGIALAYRRLIQPRIIKRRQSIRVAQLAPGSTTDPI